MAASSSSDEEERRRCEEAVWEMEDADKGKHSKRVAAAAANHERDGNQLQVTQGFQTHVAKKLGQYLDSHISEGRTESSQRVKSADCHDHEGGFRLFSTSVPGQTAAAPPPPARRRPVPSSSDSDSEMESRLKEAAVSFNDLLPSSSPPTPPSAEPPTSEPQKKKKKKKKKEKLAEQEQNQLLQKQSDRDGSQQGDCTQEGRSQVEKQKKP
ncbi:protein CUSTOS [Aulostomus maculatus]